MLVGFGAVAWALALTALLKGANPFSYVALVLGGLMILFGCGAELVKRLIVKGGPTGVHFELETLGRAMASTEEARDVVEAIEDGVIDDAELVNADPLNRS